MVSFKAFPAVALAGVLASAQASLAAEGGFSFYLPGTAGDVALAQSSEPGLQVANTVFFQSGNAGAAVLAERRSRVRAVLSRECQFWAREAAAQGCINLAR